MLDGSMRKVTALSWMMAACLRMLAGMWGLFHFMREVAKGDGLL
jgi:hypothetical protein